MSFNESTSLAPALQQVIEEVRSSFPQREIEAELDLKAPVNCDPSRIAQVLSNLLANALAHGAKDGKVRVNARSTGFEFSLTVFNEGEPIPRSRRQGDRARSPKHCR